MVRQQPGVAYSLTIRAEYENDPGMLGELTSAIGDANVNIANLTLGRDEPGGRATTLLNLDGPLDEDTLEKIGALPHVNQVRQVNL